PGKRKRFITINKGTHNESDSAVHLGIRATGPGGRIADRLSLAGQVRNAAGICPHRTNRPVGLGHDAQPRRRLDLARADSYRRDPLDHLRRYPAPKYTQALRWYRFDSPRFLQYQP